MCKNTQISSLFIKTLFFQPSFLLKQANLPASGGGSDFKQVKLFLLNLYVVGSLPCIFNLRLLRIGLQVKLGKGETVRVRVRVSLFQSSQ